MPVEELERDVDKDVETLATNLGCFGEDIPDMIDCLREKSSEEHLTELKRLGYSVRFSPLIDGDFIKFNPKNISRRSEDKASDEVDFFRSLDILSGFNAYEGVLFLPFLIQAEQMEGFSPSQEDMKTLLVPHALNFLYKTDSFKTEIVNLVASHYTSWTGPSDTNNTRLHEAGQIIRRCKLRHTGDRYGSSS
jgi:hypothetical protein